MIRRVAMAVAILAVLAGCGSSAAQIDDPKQIVTKSVESVQNVKTLHLKADITGTVPFSLTGQAGASMKLDGTSAEGDMDIAGKKAHITVSVPALLGLTAEVIVVDTDTYIKTSLSGDKWMKSSASSLAGGLGGLASAIPAASAAASPMTVDQAISKIKDFLDKPGVTTKKLGDESVDGKDCYHVQVTIPASEIQSAVGSAAPLPSGMSLGSDVTLDLWVEKSSTHPIKLATNLDVGSGAKVGVTVTLSNYDASVSISAPPADQVTEGGSLFGQ